MDGFDVGEVDTEDGSGCGFDDVNFAEAAGE